MMMRVLELRACLQLKAALLFACHPAPFRAYSPLFRIRHCANRIFSLQGALAQPVDRDTVEQTIEDILADGGAFETLSVQQRNLVWKLCWLAIRTGYEEK